MNQKSCEIFIVKPPSADVSSVSNSGSNSNTYEMVAGPLTCTYKAGTDTLQGLVPSALAAFAAVIKRRNLAVAEASPNCITTTNRALLERHWRVIVAKRSKMPPETTPVEDVVQELNIDRFLSTSYRRTMTDPNNLMPEIWLVPKSSDAQEFIEDCVEAQQVRSGLLRTDRSLVSDFSSASPVRSAAANDNDEDASAVTSLSVLSASRFGAPRASSGVAGGGGSRHRSSLDMDDADDGGATASASPERISRAFDKSLQEFVDRRASIFNAKFDDRGAAAGDEQTRGYVHWSDVLVEQQQRSSPSSSSAIGFRSLRSFHGDKASLSEALGAAWETAAEEESKALAAYCKAVAARKSTLETKVAAVKAEQAAAAAREQQTTQQVESIAVKKALLVAKEDRLKRVQDEVKLLELRLQAEQAQKEEMDRCQVQKLSRQLDEKLRNNATTSSGTGSRGLNNPTGAQASSGGVAGNNAASSSSSSSFFTSKSSPHHRAFIVDNVGGFNHHRHHNVTTRGSSSTGGNHHRDAATTPLAGFAHATNSVLATRSALDAAMSLLSPNTAASVHGALLGNGHQHEKDQGDATSQMRNPERRGQDAGEDHYQQHKQQQQQQQEEEEEHVPIPRAGEDISSYVSHMLRGMPSNRSSHHQQQHQQQRHDRIAFLRERAGLRPLPSSDEDGAPLASFDHAQSLLQNGNRRREIDGDEYEEDDGDEGEDLLDQLHSEPHEHQRQATYRHQAQPPRANYQMVAADAGGVPGRSAAAAAAGAGAARLAAAALLNFQSSRDPAAFLQNGALASLANEHHHHHHRQQQQQQGADLRVPLRLLASELDAYLTRVDDDGDDGAGGDVAVGAARNNVVSTMERQRLQRAQTSGAGAGRNFYDEDVDARQRLHQRVHELKKSLAQPKRG